jgi:hypothetical protein
METHKLKIKIGPHEFEAEGSEESVTAQFQAWKELVAAIPTKAPDKATPSRLSAVVEEIQTKDGYKTATWDIYECPEEGMVTLKVQPTGEQRHADAVLLLLWGFKQTTGKDDVPVTKLMEALSVSGLRVGRLDRVMGDYLKEGLILKGGKAKGGRYRLTNTGAVKAENMARILFEQLV